MSWFLSHFIVFIPWRKPLCCFWSLCFPPPILSWLGEVGVSCYHPSSGFYWHNGKREVLLPLGHSKGPESPLGYLWHHPSREVMRYLVIAVQWAEHEPSIWSALIPQQQDGSAWLITTKWEWKCQVCTWLPLTSPQQGALGCLIRQSGKDGCVGSPFNICQWGSEKICGICLE